MTPTYQLRVWQEDDWWLARVVAASDSADPAPLNALTQARSLARIESMGHDLIATILDADEEDFSIELEFVLPEDVSELVCQAKGARAWLDAAQDLWQERSMAAVRALADRGYSLRETAALLGLSHQRVDQLLGAHADHQPSKVLLFQCKSNLGGEDWHRSGFTAPHDIDAFLLVRPRISAFSSWAASHIQAVDTQFKEQVEAFVIELASHMSVQSDAAET